MPRIITDFKKILMSLCKLQESAWNGKESKWKPSNRALATYEVVFEQRLQSLKQLSSEMVEHFFSQSDTAKVNFFEKRMVLYLPPMKKDAEDAEFVPIFSFCCNLSKDQSIARFRVMLVTLDKEDNTKLNGIGFRMETPDGTGIHDFHHAQLIHQFSPKRFGNILPTECPSWLPESQPSFPMPADCPVTLLLCIILTLYGWEYYKDFCSRIPDIDHYRNKIDSLMGKRKV